MTETTNGEFIKFASHSIGGMMLAVDVLTVLGLGFEYVLPVVLSLPKIDPTRALTALAVLLFLALMQVLFLPLIAFLFELPPDEP